MELLPLVWTRRNGSRFGYYHWLANGHTNCTRLVLSLHSAYDVSFVGCVMESVVCKDCEYDGGCARCEECVNCSLIVYADRRKDY